MINGIQAELLNHYSDGTEEWSWRGVNIYHGPSIPTFDVFWYHSTGAKMWGYDDSHKRAVIYWLDLLEIKLKYWEKI